MKIKSPLRLINQKIGNCHIAQLVYEGFYVIDCGLGIDQKSAEDNLTNNVVTYREFLKKYGRQRTAMLEKDWKIIRDYVVFPKVVK